MNFSLDYIYFVNIHILKKEINTNIILNILKKLS